MKQKLLPVNIFKRLLLLLLCFFTMPAMAEHTVEDMLKADRDVGEHKLFIISDGVESIGEYDGLIRSGRPFYICMAVSNPVYCVAYWEKEYDDSKYGHHSYAGSVTTENFLKAWNEGKVRLVDEEVPPAPLSEKERSTLIDIMQKLLAWLKGEGDPLGLGKHTGPLESIVINVIGIIGATLLGNGIASVGGSGASAMVQNIIGGLTGSTPPPVPPTQPTPPDLPNVNRREEDDDDEVQVAPPGNENKGFQPTHYPELCKQFMRQNPDGTVSMRDPITGKNLTYYPTPDGKGWESESGTTYTNESLEENLRYRYENADTLRQDADRAARNVAEQHAQWEADNERQRREGSDMEKELAKKEAARAALEAQRQAEQHRQEYLEQLAAKYNVPNTEKALKDIIKFEQQMAQNEHDAWMADEKDIANREAVYNVIDKGAELAVNTMGECIPGGRVVKNAYTFIKSVGVSAVDAGVKGKTGLDLVMAINSGVVDGTLGVIQNQAGDITNNPWVEGAMVVGGEGIRNGFKAISEGKSPDEVLDSMKNGMVMKTAFFGIGKGIQTGMNAWKDSSPAFAEVMTPGSSAATNSFGNSAVWQTAEKYIGKGGFNLSGGGGFDAIEAAAAGGQEAFATTFNVLSEQHDDRIAQQEQFTKNVKDFSDAAAEYRRR